MWARCKNKEDKTRHWCNFWKLKLDRMEGKSGVYVIWADSGFPYAIYVGQGDIADRIKDHRGERPFIKIRDDGEKMFVTWQPFTDNELDGREKYLADLLNPVIGQRHPRKAKPIKTDPPPPLK